MNNTFATIAPAMEALTRTYCPARKAASAMSSSVRLPKVAFSRPPIDIARLGRDGFGGAAEKGGQWHDRQHGKHKQERVRVRLEQVDRKQYGHEGEQP